ncbi:MAG: NYN domain-containing protein [Panacagrimonas sp.]
MQLERPVFVDALNLCWWCGKPPSLRIPMALMQHLLGTGHRAVLYFDASAPHQLRDEAALYGELREHARYCIEAPSGIPADRLMLRHATTQSACVVSRDHYRDHRRRYRKLIDDPTRLISGHVEADQVRLPTWDVRQPLSASAATAWDSLRPLLSA